MCSETFEVQSRVIEQAIGVSRACLSYMSIVISNISCQCEPYHAQCQERAYTVVFLTLVGDTHDTFECVMFPIGLACDAYVFHLFDQNQSCKQIQHHAISEYRIPITAQLSVLPSLTLTWYTLCGVWLLLHMLTRGLVMSSHVYTCIIGWKEPQCVCTMKIHICTTSRM